MRLVWGHLALELKLLGASEMSWVGNWEQRGQGKGLRTPDTPQ